MNSHTFRQNVIHIWGRWGSLLINTAYLIITTLAGSLFGFLFWVIAARSYDASQIGLGAALIAAITLLANLGDMGLGITAIRFIPTMACERDTFINSSWLAVAISTFVLAVIYVVVAPLGSAELKLLYQIDWRPLLFLASAVFFSLAQYFDRIYIAYQATRLMFFRNLLANVLRIALLIAIGTALGAFGLLLAVAVGAFSTLILSAFVFVPRIVQDYRLRLKFFGYLLWDKARYSLSNHFSQLLWNAPPLFYPLLVLSLLGAEANASFYVSWMIANIIFIIPTSLSSTLLAHYANQNGFSRNDFWRLMIFTLLILVPLVTVAIISSGHLLGVFGRQYLDTGLFLLLLLLISAFPYTINTFIIVDFRIRENNQGVALVSGSVAVLCAFLIVVMSPIYSLVGVGYGWLAGQTIGSFFSCLYQYHSQAGIAHEIFPEHLS